LAASNDVRDSGPSSRPARGDPSNSLAGGASGQAKAPLPVPVAHLVYQARAGTDKGPSVIVLAGQDVTIGRAPGCDVTLADDPLASRRHSMLRYDGQRYTVKDLGSSNGTYLNDVEIHEANALASGDRITVGEHEFAYMDASEPLPGQGMAGAAPERYNTDGYAVRVPPSWPPAPGRASAPPAAYAVSQAAIPVARDPMTRDIEELRTRLMEVSTALAQRTGSAEEVARRLREIMGELYERVERAMAVPGATAPDGAVDAPDARVDELIQAAHATVENPRHLDVVTALAGHAGALAQTLDAQRRYIAALEATRQGLVAALHDIHARLAGLIEDERQVDDPQPPEPQA
jgi:hypothetical protein